MVYCPECGEETEDNNSFCSECGINLDEPHDNRSQKNEKSETPILETKKRFNYILLYYKVHDLRFLLHLIIIVLTGTIWFYLLALWWINKIIFNLDYDKYEKIKNKIRKQNSNS